MIHNYVDGVSITYGYPRQYLFTYALSQVDVYLRFTGAHITVLVLPLLDRHNQLWLEIITTVRQVQLVLHQLPHIIPITNYGMAKIVLLEIAVVLSQKCHTCTGIFLSQLMELLTLLKSEFTRTPLLLLQLLLSDLHWL